MLLMLLVGCSTPIGPGDATRTASDGWGKLRTHLIDSPIEVDGHTVSSVLLVLERVDAHQDGGGWLRIDTGEPIVVDLLELQDGVFAEIGDAVLPVGVYDELRLVVAESGAAIVVDDEIEGLECPSCTSSGLKLKGTFEVRAGARTTAVIDLDAQKSLRRSKGNGNGWKLHPVLTVVSIHLEPGVFSAATITQAAGGTLSLPDGAEVVFGPGDVPVDEVYWIEKEGEATAGGTLWSAVYDFGPHAVFPAGVPVTLPYAEPPAELAGVGPVIRSDFEAVVITAHDDVANLITGRFTHFSRGDVAPPTDEEMAQASAGDTNDDGITIYDFSSDPKCPHFMVWADPARVDVKGMLASVADYGEAGRGDDTYHTVTVDRMSAPGAVIKFNTSLFDVHSTCINPPQTYMNPYPLPVCFKDYENSVGWLGGVTLVTDGDVVKNDREAPEVQLRESGSLFAVERSDNPSTETYPGLDLVVGSPSSIVWEGRHESSGGDPWTTPDAWSYGCSLGESRTSADGCLGEFRNEQTVVGLTSGNHIALLVTWGGGMTYWHVYKRLQALDVQRAIVLDGGGSSQIVVNGTRQGGSREVVAGAALVPRPQVESPTCNARCSAAPAAGWYCASDDELCWCDGGVATATVPTSACVSEAQGTHDHETGEAAPCIDTCASAAFTGYYCCSGDDELLAWCSGGRTTGVGNCVSCSEQPPGDHDFCDP